MGRISRGWDLTKKSWAVLKADKRLMVLPILSFFFILVALIVIVGAGGLIANSTDSDRDQTIALVVAVVIFAYLATFIGVFFNVALVATAARVADGESATIRDGLAAAGRRLGPIIAWSFLAATVGILLRAIEARFRLIGDIVAGIVGTAWALVTFLVVPVIAFEGLGGGASVKRSAHLFKERWGEQVVGNFSIGGIFGLLIGLPAIIVAVVGYYILANSNKDALGIALIAIGVVVFAIAALISSTLHRVFSVMLYRYATGKPLGFDFQESELASAFRPKRGGRNIGTV